MHSHHHQNHEHEEKPLKIPTNGLGFSRKNLPQLGPSDEFLSNIAKHGIKYKEVSVPSHKLKASQAEFQHDTIRQIMNNPRPTKSKVIISNDDHVLDGHHRWLANYNHGVNTQGVRVDMGIHDLIKLAKTFKNTTYKSITDTIGRVVKECLMRKNYK